MAFLNYVIFRLLVLFQTTNAPSLEVDVDWAKNFEPKVVHMTSSRSKQRTANQSKDKFLKGVLGQKL